MKHAALIVKVLSSTKIVKDFDGYFDHYSFFCAVVPELIKAGESPESAEKICGDSFRVCKGEPRFIKNIK
jgi:hypothetical protein